MAQKRGRSPPADDKPQVFHSNPIEDRQSTFIAHFSPSQSAKTLQAAPEFKSASHRMAAWRKASTQRTLSSDRQIFTTGSDDDGEKYGGKRLERVLNEAKVTGAVVVARWYGGVLLGPVRFTHIENAAKEAIGAWRESTGERPAAKVRKVEQQQTSAGDDEADRKRLTKQLTDRDQSIVVLRQLLAEKQAMASVGAQPDMVSSSQPSSSAATAIDYAEMPLLRLRQLDKARDATIAWILKQIDQAETKEKEVAAAAAVGKTKEEG
ncbi:uncharacterized protein HMPREF1541_08695 [Cyphellophora europaea CBS 101466]|uniref:Impact N-terminal domain-containing protein n=1 Tax=Cyphellophora europaea (strain CBS 101466) TaxID=1220924 RepID=W2RL48_CYPE1|nr:uncharacterized protein HMPREF1541_08695 [Cyphellophora europaea CBS 101466]ETN36418.1 hypothetical protein HMPREF1541_08695 [Cyphellophora europaea CBS 101466]